jgi:hypothetical protein
MGIVSLIAPARGIMVESKAVILVLTRSSSEMTLFNLPKRISGIISRSRKIDHGGSHDRRSPFFARAISLFTYSVHMS